MALATVPTARGSLLPEAVEGHRVGYFPASRLLYAEGHPDPAGLAAVSELPATAERVWQGLCDRGVCPPAWKYAPHQRMTSEGLALMPVVGGTGFAGVRRLDATVELRRSAEVGAAVLGAVASLPLSRLKSDVIRASGQRRVETVRFLGARGVLARVYDKGVESGSDGPGERIRFEDQRRFGRGSRLALEHFTEADLVPYMFRARFAPVWESSQGVTVAGRGRVAERLRELVAAGVVTRGEADRLMGLVTLGEDGLSRATVYRRRAQLRATGLVEADAGGEELEVDLAGELRELLEADFGWN